MSKIRTVEWNKEKNEVKLVFGPHYFINLIEKDNKVKIQVGATHHWVEFDASEVGKAWEDAIEELKRRFPKAPTDYSENAK